MSFPDLCSVLTILLKCSKNYSLYNSASIYCFVILPLVPPDSPAILDPDSILDGLLGSGLAFPPNRLPGDLLIDFKWESPLLDFCLPTFVTLLLVLPDGALSDCYCNVALDSIPVKLSPPLPFLVYDFYKGDPLVSRNADDCDKSSGLVGNYLVYL